MRRDEDSFVEFAHATRDRLRRMVYLACGDWELAADHVQEGLVRVYVAWPRLTKQGREYAYARKAVMSAFLDHGRRRSSHEHPHGDASLVGGPVVGDHAESVATRAVIVEALGDLPPRQRAVVVLRFFEDLTVSETAAALGCSEGTVKSQTSKALSSLRTHLDDVRPDVLAQLGASTW